MKKINNFFSWDKGPKNAIIIAIILAVSLISSLQLIEISRKIAVIPYSTFLQSVQKGEIKEIYVDAQDVRGSTKNGIDFQVTVPVQGVDCDLLTKYGVAFQFANSSDYSQYWYMILTLLVVIIILATWYFIRQTRGGTNNGNGNVFSMSKSKAKMFLPTTIKENFNSVAGAAEAKEELFDIVDYLRNPNKYKRLGAKMTRGVLLVGEPGNGKTLLARAVAGEANCPFLSVSGSDFIEVFVGVGAARMRDLFDQARKNAPSIIFIDEIDSVGRHRGSGLGGGHDEREQTLNQLLTEMDGFETNESSIIVIAATNRPDVLDKALLRPGRFDRQVEVPFPDRKSREEILVVHAKGVSIDKGVSLANIAKGTPGFSGADLANLINEAAIQASKDESNVVELKHFEEARDKVLLGKEVKSIALTPEERKTIAYHEGGHALVRLLLPDCTDPLHKVTIIPRGRSLGVTHSLPDRERYITSKEEMEASVIAALGGRAAEEIVFGALTTGAASDLQTATQIVRRMVCSYGMMPESLGTILYAHSNTDSDYSDKTAEKIDAAIKEIMDTCYKRAYVLLESNRAMLDILANALLEKETMYAAEIYELLNIPPRVDHRFE